MPRRCKTCTSTLRDEIDRQIMQGASFTYLAQWCCDRGLQITDTALRKHANNHIEGYKPKVFSEVKQAPPVDTIAHQPPDPTIVDFEAYLKKIELNNLKEIIKEGKSHQHFESLQLSVAENFFRLSAILNQKLIDYAQGKCKFPIEQVKCLNTLFDVYNKATGVGMYANHYKALTIMTRHYGVPTVFREGDNILHIQENESDEIIIVDLEKKTVEVKIENNDN